MTKIALSLFLRYGLAAVITIFTYNQVNHIWPLSWIDKDRREISRLTDELEACNVSKNDLIVQKVDLENAIILQNKAIQDLIDKGKAKELENKKAAERFKNDLKELEQKLDADTTEINSCQDAIDFIIGEK